MSNTENQVHTTYKMSQSPYVLEIKTVQASTFKQIVDALKEILIDVNFEFDETGMKVVALDNTHVVLVHLKLAANKFETYYCENRRHIGLNMLKLHMLIKTISNNDVLTLFVERDDHNRLGIRIENPDKNMCTTYKLDMLDLDITKINIPPADFQTTINMPSSDFQKIVRDMNHLGDFIEIRSVENQLAFYCKGDFCTQETVFATDKNPNLNIERNSRTESHEIIQGVYSLKYLAMFTKCTNLSNVVSLFLQNNFPLVVEYQVGSLGTIKICLAQQDN